MIQKKRGAWDLSKERNSTAIFQKGSRVTEREELTDANVSSSDMQRESPKKKSELMGRIGRGDDGKSNYGQEGTLTQKIRQQLSFTLTRSANRPSGMSRKRHASIKGEKKGERLGGVNRRKGATGKDCHGP